MVLMKLFAGQDSHTDVEKGLAGKAGEGEVGTNRESSTDIYTPPWVKWVPKGKVLYNKALCSVMAQRGERVVQERRDTCILMADSYGIW